MFIYFLQTLLVTAMQHTNRIRIKRKDSTTINYYKTNKFLSQIPTSLHVTSAGLPSYSCDGYAGGKWNHDDSDGLRMGDDGEGVNDDEDCD